MENRKVEERKKQVGNRVKTYYVRETTLTQELLSLVLKILGIMVVFLLLFTFLFGIFRNRDLGMAPAVKEGDLVMYYRLDKRYLVDDLLILEYEGMTQVRRVVAVAGDRVDITERGLEVNGSHRMEEGISEETLRYVDGIEYPVVVGEGEVFVLGDARDGASDSRLYGPVKISDTAGKVMTLARRRNL